MAKGQPTLIPFAMKPFAGANGIAIAGTLTVEAGALKVVYRLDAPVKSRVMVPKPAPAQFVEGLWGATCFECFVSREGDERYVEWNLAPNGQWATFAYAAYRRRVEILPSDIEALRPQVTFERNADRHVEVMTLTAVLPLASLQRIWSSDLGALRIGLSAVVARRGLFWSQRRSYWALVHDADVPDFHRRSSFLIEGRSGHAP